MDKIDENYIQKRIQDSRKNWYIYFYGDDRQKDIGIFKADSEKEAYIKFFNKFSYVLMPLFLNEKFHDPMIKNIREKTNYNYFRLGYAPYFLQKLAGNFDERIENEYRSLIASILFLKNIEERYMLHEMIYRYIKNPDERYVDFPMRGIKIYIQKY